MRIQLLGRFELVCGERTIETAKSPRLESLLAYLVLHPGAPQPRRRLSSLFWPDSDESQARTNLRQLLHNLRHTVPEADRFLDSDSANLSWRADAPFELDVAQFERAVERAKAPRSENPCGERAALEEAARLYTGDLLPDVYDEWIEPLREGLRRKSLEALHRLVSLFEKEGDPGGALAYAELMVKQDPLDEESYRQLMRLCALKGDRAGALRAYHRCETTLRRELDVEPDKETRELRERLKNVSPAEEPPRSDGPQSLADQTPLVGRKREWAQLLEAWRSADSGRASLALISGEAGIGKTRLSEELLATASRQGIATGRARCYSAEGSLAYAPVADWLRSDALRPALASLHPAQLSELSRILPELTVERPEVPPPEPLAEGWQRQRFFDTLSRVFLQVRPPLLLLLDDVQWCDRESIEWLHHLLRVDPRARLLVVGTERVEETSADHPAKKLLTELQRSERLTSIELGPLDAGETVRLASHVLSRELEPDRAADLYRETEGNPFFVVESMRAALETRSIPPRVRAVLSARLAQLSPMAHELVGLAATVGRSFSFEVLSLCSGHDEDRLVRALDELWQRRIVRSQGAQEYDFTHDKLRELAYAELPPGRQSLLHRRVARGLEKRFASDLDPWASAIAIHYYKAGSAEFALPYYERAARWAQTLYAHPEAVSYLTAARELLSKLTDVREREEFELSILVTLAASLRVLHGYAASELGPVYARARELSGRIARPTQNVAVLWGAWLFHNVRAELGTARVLAEELLELARREDVADYLVTGHFSLGSTLFHLGELESSRQNFEKAFALYQAAQHRTYMRVLGLDPGVFSLSYLGHVLWLQGQPDRALENTHRALSLAEALEDPFSQAIALDYAAIHYLFRREAATAREKAEAALKLCRQHGFAYYLAWATVMSGWAMTALTGMTGDERSEAAVATMRHGLELLRTARAELRRPFYLSLLAQAGEPGCLEEALSLVSEERDVWVAAELHRLEAEALREGQEREAEVRYRRAIEIARAQGARAFELRAAVGLARLWQRQGRFEEARTLLQGACGPAPDASETVDSREARSLLDDLSPSAP